ncbi:MAG: hypothetical protein WKF88_02480 [Ferruginibacter sp.]
MQATSAATITDNASVCQNATAPLITFTAANGIAPFTFTYNINNGAAQTISTTRFNTVTLPVPMTASGTFVYNPPVCPLGTGAVLHRSPVVLLLLSLILFLPQQFREQQQFVKTPFPR